MNIAGRLDMRFGQTGQIEDVEEGISHHLEVAGRNERRRTRAYTTAPTLHRMQVSTPCNVR